MHEISLGGTTRGIPFQQFVGGIWRDGDGGSRLPVENPYTGEQIGQIVLASVTDVEQAYRAALTAQVEWAAMLPRERAAIFHRALALLNDYRQDVIEWLIAEAGSTRIKASIEFQTVQAQMAEFAALPYRMIGQILPSDVPGKESRVYRKPVGVVGVISPWNWPMTLAHRSIGAALALGNSVVAKPADETPVTGGLMIARLYEEAGLPKGLLNVVIGDVREIGDAFIVHDIPRVISFTGSTKVGRHVAGLASSAPRIKHVALELGGNAPLIVLEDADLDRAVSAAIFGRFLHQGQICMSTNRIIVLDGLYQAFEEQFVERVRGLRAGDPADPETAIGPIISKRHLARLVGLIEQASREAKPLTGGEPQGLVLPPHVFGTVDNDSALAQGEVFGPIAPLIRARSEAHAVQLANTSEYGLTSAVFSRDSTRAEAFARKLDVGMTHINDITINAAANAPFGGEKNSGLGRFGGDWILHEFASEHWVTVQNTPRSYPF